MIIIASVFLIRSCSISSILSEEILNHLIGGIDDYDKSPIERLTDRERIKEKLNLKHASELMRHAMLWVENGYIDVTPEK